MYSIIKCYLRHILAVCVVSLCVMTGTAASSVKLDVDWPQFMSKQDRAFITRLVEGTIEYQTRLDYVINQYSRTKVNKCKPLIRCLLRMGV